MKRDEQGIALVITLFLMASLSALAVSMMFLSQTETASSRNYRTMSQARYAGEAGVHKAINYLNYTYGKPTTATLASMDMTKSPVTCVSGCTRTTTTTCDASTPATAVSTGCIVLVANFGSLTSNYPDASVITAFSTAGQGTLPVNASGSTTNQALGTVRFKTAAILLSVRPLVVYGGSSDVVQTWQIVSDGTAGPTSSLATVEVMGTFEKSAIPAETFAVFATDPGCGAITYSGSGRTDSYDSNAALGANGKPVVSDSGGAVGTNGNLSLGGTVDIYGNLSTPRTGVGTCEEGAVTALTTTGSANLHGETIHLPQSKVYPTPNVPSVLATAPDLDFSGTGLTATTCATTMAAQGWTCTVSGNTYTIAPAGSSTLNVKNISIGANKTLVIAGSGTATINANSFITAGTSTLSVSPVTTLNLKGSYGVDPVMDMQGNFSTTSYDPTKLQIAYDGTGTIKLRGNNELAATIYAPNALVDLSSSYDVYGSILAGRYSNSGGAIVHYDTRLSSKYFTISNPFMSAFTWKKY